jgi:hypothetical protein
MTLGLYSTPAPADLSTSSCFNCSELGHFASSCLKPRSMPKINEIEQEDNKALGDNEITDNKESDSEN